MYTCLRDVYDAVRQCQRCPLAATRKNTVFGEGRRDADILFIGEGPGAVEDETGRPFVGPAGQLLDRMLAAIQLERREVYICNVVKCRPPGNSVPTRECVEQCIGYLREQVRYVHPKIIVCLGATAMEHVLGQKGITRLHGTVYRKKSFILIPTFHPSALLRNEELKRPAWEDFKKIRAILEEVRGSGSESSV